jgi:hypothetical protein
MAQIGRKIQQRTLMRSILAQRRSTLAQRLASSIMSLSLVKTDQMVVRQSSMRLNRVGCS